MSGDPDPLRTAVREFLAAELAAGGFEPRCDSWLAGYDPAFSVRLAERGWVGMTLPKEYGGQARSQLERYQVLEELLAAGAPVAAHWIADRQSGPLILRYGTEEQRRRFLPAIARGECHFGIGMSEPDSGSDLASIRTSARRVEGGWLVNGAKIWTSHAHRSGFMVTLVRTSPQTDDRHAGLSQLIVDLHGPGIEIRPIALLSGEPHFNEVVFTEAFIPEAALVGREGEGWLQVTSELTHERSGPERFLSTFPLLRELAREVGSDPSPSAAAAMGELIARLWALRQMSIGVAGLLERGKQAHDQAAVGAALVKDLGTRFESSVIERSRDVISPRAAGKSFRRLYQEALAAAPGFTLRGGTSEILRGIIARSLKVEGALGQDAEGEDRLLGETAEAVFAGERDTAAEYRRAGLADVRELGLPAATLVVRVAAYHCGPEPVYQDLIAERPLLRAAQLAGAAARARDLTVQYAAERRQFGQPINRFQAVQHQLAEMAGEAAIARAGVDQALRDPSPIRVAAAKAVSGRAAARVAAIAHQVHGAIGFTKEHSLHRSTTSIWRWRDEEGTDTEHAITVGRGLAGRDIWAATTS